MQWFNILRKMSEEEKRKLLEDLNSPNVSNPNMDAKPSVPNAPDLEMEELKMKLKRAIELNEPKKIKTLTKKLKTLMDKKLNATEPRIKRRPVKNLNREKQRDWKAVVGGNKNPIPPKPDMNAQPPPPKPDMNAQPPKPNVSLEEQRKKAQQDKINAMNARGTKMGSSVRFAPRTSILRR